MSGRGGQGIDRGGQGGRGSSGQVRGSIHYTPTLNKNKFVCSELGKNIFDYDQKGAAYQMQTTWENILRHFSTIYGHDIRKCTTEQNKVIHP